MAGKLEDCEAGSPDDWMTGKSEGRRARRSFGSPIWKSADSADPPKLEDFFALSYMRARGGEEGEYNAKYRKRERGERGGGNGEV